MHRTTILLEARSVEQLRTRASRRGTSLSAEIREAVAEYLAREDPNAGLKALIGTAVGHGNYPPVESAHIREEMARSIYRDAMGLPDDVE